MSSHSRKPRNFHELERETLNDGIRRLTHIGEIVTTVLDDLLMARDQPLHGIPPEEKLTPCDELCNEDEFDELGILDEL